MPRRSTDVDELLSGDHGVREALREKLLDHVPHDDPGVRDGFVQAEAVVVDPAEHQAV